MNYQKTLITISFIAITSFILIIGLALRDKAFTTPIWLVIFSTIFAASIFLTAMFFNFKNINSNIQQKFFNKTKQDQTWRMVFKSLTIFGFSYYAIQEKKWFGLYWKTIHEDPSEENCHKILNKLADGTIKDSDLLRLNLK